MARPRMSTYSNTNFLCTVFVPPQSGILPASYVLFPGCVLTVARALNSQCNPVPSKVLLPKAVVLDRCREVAIVMFQRITIDVVSPRSAPSGPQRIDAIVGAMRLAGLRLHPDAGRTSHFTLQRSNTTRGASQQITVSVENNAIKTKQQGDNGWKKARRSERLKATGPTAGG